MVTRHVALRRGLRRHSARPRGAALDRDRPFSCYCHGDRFVGSLLLRSLQLKLAIAVPSGALAQA